MNPRLLSFFIILHIIIFASNGFGQVTVLWCDGNSNGPAIKRADQDGSNVSNIISSGLVNPSGIAFDSDTNKFYWTDFALNSINRADLAGTNIETINSSVQSPNGIAIDTINDKVYWSEGSLDRDIFRSNLDGSNVERIVDTTVTGGPESIAIDPVGAKIYWVDVFNQVVKRANTDGTNEQIVLMGGTTAIPVQGLGLDLNNSKIYISDSNGMIYVANLDGSGAQSFANISGLAGSMAVHTTLNKLYISDSERVSIRRINLDATGLEDIVDSSNAGNPNGIVLVYPTPTVTPTPTATPRPLTTGTTITVPPTITVSGRSVTILLEQFSIVSISSRANLRRSPAELRYDVRVTKDSNHDIRRKVTKQNQATFNKLPPGGYKARYRAMTVRKRSKSDRKKAEQRGKTGFEAKYRTEVKTNFSPPASFTIQ